jgi:anti-sigma factor RsiW
MQRGYHLCHWVHNGLAYWVVADLNPQELSLLARLLREPDGS